MIAHRSSRFFASGLLVGLLVLVAAVGLFGSSSLRSLANAPAMRGTRDSPLAQDPLPAPPRLPETASCRVVGTPFEPDAGDENTMWSRLQNIGATTATLHALELGWEGPAVLRGVVVRSEPTVTLISVHSERTTSPALLVLSDGDGKSPVLEPGATIEMGLQFEDANEIDLRQALGPVVAFMREGCAVSLGEARTAPQPCHLGVSELSFSEMDPTRIQFTIANRDDQPAMLATLEASWPAKANGRLVAIIVNQIERLRFEEGQGPANSPTVIDLRRLGVEPVALAPNMEAEVRLEFEQPVVHEPYVITVATRRGCLSTTSTWVTRANDDCGVDAVGFDVGDATAQLRLSNGRPVTRTLTTLDVFWPVATAGALVEVRLDGSPAWSGEWSTSPASLRLASGLVLSPRTTAEVQLVFTSTTQAQGATVGTMSGGDYTIVAGFQSGCQVVYSTLSGRPLGCNLSAGELTVDQDAKRAAVELTNAAADATLNLLAISWPARNGTLNGVWLGQQSLVDPGTEVLYSTRPVTIPLTARNAVVPRNQSQNLQLQFREFAARHGYVLSISYEDPAGARCDDLLVTVPEIQTDCRLSLDNLKVADERFVELELHNDGQDDAEIRFVDVDWPNPSTLNHLNLVTLEDPGGQRSRVVWQPRGNEGPKTRAPTRVFPNGDEAPILEADSVVTLRMRFTELLGFVEDPERAFRVTVGAGEDCQATYAKSGGQLPPEQVSFGGVIRELPDNHASDAGLFGVWKIESQGEVLLVEVDHGTEFIPSTVTPKVGDIVLIEALKSDEDRLRAVQITFRSADPGTSLSGNIDAMDPENTPPTWIEVLGRQVWIPDTTIIEGTLSVGAGVLVKGTRNPDDSIKATLIRVTSAPEARRRIVVRGVIQDGANRVEGVEHTWPVDKYLVRVPWRLLPEAIKQRPGQMPAPGERVEVKGYIEPGSANVVVVEERPKLLAEPVSERLVGRVTSLPQGGLLGTWTIEAEDGQEHSFLVDSLAVVDAGAAPADVGLWARAIVQQDGGNSIALRVRMDWQP